MLFIISTILVGWLLIATLAGLTIARGFFTNANRVSSSDSFKEEELQGTTC